MKTTLPSRQVHLDFHTAPQIPDVGAEFDAEAFGDTMTRAHVNSVTVFAKCHHGHLYYNTNRPERHPGLRADLDLLERQVEALHQRGIRLPPGRRRPAGHRHERAQRRGHGAFDPGTPGPAPGALAVHHHLHAFPAAL